MARFNVIWEDEQLAKQLRMKAVELFDGQKGSLSHAVEEAVRFWLKEGAPVSAKKK